MAKVKKYVSVPRAVRAMETLPSDGETSTVIFSGDCMDLIRSMPDDSVQLAVSSPPYCIGKSYERACTVEDFISQHKKLLPEIARVTQPGGSICWQVGYHVSNQSVYPLDFPILSIFSDISGVILRNRIVWTFGHGLHHTHRFDGRHEMVLWFTKGNKYHFDLDAVRIPQKYPGKKISAGPRKGQYSCNPKGKNPSDVWDIPNVKAKHVEKLDHPCQFPVGLVDRLVRALCPSDGLVFDPYMGSATTGVAAIINGRHFLGAEINNEYTTLAIERLEEAHNGTVRYRPAEQPIFVAGPGLAVARRPSHFGESSK